MCNATGLDEQDLETTLLYAGHGWILEVPIGTLIASRHWSSIEAARTLYRGNALLA